MPRFNLCVGQSDNHSFVFLVLSNEKGEEIMNLVKIITTQENFSYYYILSHQSRTIIFRIFSYLPTINITLWHTVTKTALA